MLKKSGLASLQRANALDPMKPQILRAISKNLLSNSKNFDDEEATELQRLADRIECLR